MPINWTLPIIGPQTVPKKKNFAQYMHIPVNVYFIYLLSHDI